MTNKICLCMIVKNEAPVIARCLESVLPFIDSWVIHDTGSTDDTMRIIGDKLDHLPGWLGQREWVDFATNRNEALNEARKHGDYVLFIDADEVLRAVDEKAARHNMQAATGKCYLFQCEYNGWNYWRNALVKSSMPFRWEGVIHEYLTCDEPHRWDRFEGPRIVVSHDGARARDPDTYKKDIEVLKRALEKDPGNTRYAFYLAQSYKDAGMRDEAVTAYLARAAMGGFEEEAWVSRLQVARLMEASPERRLVEFVEAWEARPWRAEPLVEAAKLARELRQFNYAFVLANAATKIPYPSRDKLFIDTSVYQWRALDELAVAAFHSKVPGAKGAGFNAINDLIESQLYPKHEDERMQKNFQHYMKT